MASLPKLRNGFIGLWEKLMILFWFIKCFLFLIKLKLLFYSVLFCSVFYSTPFDSEMLVLSTSLLHHIESSIVFYQKKKKIKLFSVPFSMFPSSPLPLPTHWVNCRTCSYFQTSQTGLQFTKHFHNTAAVKLKPGWAGPHRSARLVPRPRSGPRDD